MTVRVRVAPSPTGALHVGAARAALFNWLYARRHGGRFILRIDDTDTERSTAEFEEDIKESLRWLGLEWDEGVDIGGPHGSYRQSDRLDRYREAAESLVAEGFAYYDDRAAEDAEVLRERARSEGRHPGHYLRRPDSDFTRGVIRLSIPQGDPITFDDLVRGQVTFQPEDVDDFVILRSDGTPTYHLASTVDDIDYAITHVARGEDLLPSTPKHIALAEAMGARAPIYAHLPLLFGPDNKKLSKRHGATALTEFRDRGYLPEAMFNYLALLGWALPGDVTIFGRDEAIAAFDLAHVSKNPAVFDVQKLEWMNGEYIRAMAPEQFQARVRPVVEGEAGRALTSEEWQRFVAIAPLVQERTKLLPEAGAQVSFLFLPIAEYDADSWSKVIEKEGVGEVLAVAGAKLAQVEPWSPDGIEAALQAMLSDLDIGARKGLQPIRVAITGSSVSPPLYESMAALGKETSLSRIGDVLGRLG